MNRRKFVQTIATGALVAGWDRSQGATPSETPRHAAGLAGEWRFAFDENDVGLTENWFTRKLPATIILPNSTATAGVGPVYEGVDEGSFTPVRKYVGATWFQREIEISESWRGRRIELFLERALWRSEAWVDGEKADPPIDWLGVPHVHDLGVLPPGRHVLTLRVDNREIHPTGTRGHHYYEGMQTLWNGVIGRIELHARPLLSLALVRWFPSWKDGRLRLQATVENRSDQAAAGELSLRLTGANGDFSARIPYQAAANAHDAVERDFPLPWEPLPWDEFTPNLYEVELSLGDDVHRERIGFRDLGVSGRHLTINGRPLLVRYGHEGCIFPLTGHPPMEVEAWRRIFRILKEHRLNGMRCHSWTPPAAAFQAADELGVYLQTEHFWWRFNPGEDTESFARGEMRACLDQLGNHPSMCQVLYGNELSGDLEKFGAWINEDRQYDPRHQYGVAAGRRVKNADDFYEYGSKMNWSAPGTDWDYSAYYAQCQEPFTPEFTHELGQAWTHPDWREMEKYTGVLQPGNWEKFRRLAEKAGVAAQSAAFLRASGNLNRINYKADIEAQLRTPECAGYGLLDMHDYPGQNEALVGWLDSFYDEKGFLTAAEFRKYGACTVPLARFEKYVWVAGETMNVAVEVAHYGPRDLTDAVAEWRILDSAGETKAQGLLPAKTIPAGGVTRLGNLSHPWPQPTPRGEKWRLVLRLEGTDFTNDWDLWVLPAPTDAEQSPPAPDDSLLVTSDVTAALAALEAGKNVLLDAHAIGSPSLGAFATFKPVFWSAAYFSADASSVSGAVIRADHPALAGFPTGDVLDWQWQPLCSDANDFTDRPASSWRTARHSNLAHGFDLSDLPADYRPIVQPVCDFHRPLKLGTLFELKLQNGGNLLVSGYRITPAENDHPVLRQYRRSLLAYVRSAAFTPGQEVTKEWLLRKFHTFGENIPLPEEYKDAFLHIEPGGGLAAWEKGRHEWRPDIDRAAFPGAPLEYRVQCDGVWQDEGGKAWFGKTILLEVFTKGGEAGRLRLHFGDWNRAHRSGRVESVDDQVRKLGPHGGDGAWVEFKIRREDSREGEIRVRATAESGPNLMIDQVVMLPEE